MRAASKWSGMLIVGFAMSGCASQNYDFASVTNGPSRIKQLVADLEKVSGEGAADEELYEISLLPLVHSHLHVFAEADEQDTPAEFIEADIDSYLPLFGFVNGTVSQYDENRDLLTRHEFDSSVWGAFRNERELVVTRSGNRERTRHTILWLFSWWGDETWHPAAEVTLRDERDPGGR